MDVRVVVEVGFFYKLCMCELQVDCYVCVFCEYVLCVVVFSLIILVVIKKFLNILMYIVRNLGYCVVES